ncbi:MAG: hypothetical protein WAL66_12030 [Nitrososphaeraceae archaeon]
MMPEWGDEKGTEHEQTLVLWISSGINLNKVISTSKGYNTNTSVHID